MSKELIIATEALEESGRPIRRFTNVPPAPQRERRKLLELLVNPANAPTNSPT